MSTRYRASRALQAFILSRAGDYVAVDRDTLPEVQAMIDLNYEPDMMPVWSGGCERTIYSAPAVNHAFRAWHDRLHIRLGAAFNADGEFRVACAHVAEARKAGLSDADCCALWADVWGQFRYAETHGGEFPANQDIFVAAVFRRCLDAAITATY